MIGDYLYTQTARDTRVTPLDLTFATRNSSAILATLTASMSTPQESALVLKHVFVFTEAGTGQGILRMQTTVQNAEALTLCELDQQLFAGPGGVQSASMQRSFNDLVIPPAHAVFTIITFTAAPGVVNSLNLSVAGILIPRGNFSLGQMR